MCVSKLMPNALPTVCIVREWKYNVQEVSCECEWALLRSGRTYLSCCVMDPTGYLHKVWHWCHLVLRAAFQWSFTVCKVDILWTSRSTSAPSVQTLIKLVSVTAARLKLMSVENSVNLSFMVVMMALYHCNSMINMSQVENWKQVEEQNRENKEKWYLCFCFFTVSSFISIITLHNFFNFFNSGPIYLLKICIQPFFLPCNM